MRVIVIFVFVVIANAVECVPPLVVIAAAIIVVIAYNNRTPRQIFPATSGSFTVSLTI